MHERRNEATARPAQDAPARRRRRWVLAGAGVFLMLGTAVALPLAVPSADDVPFKWARIAGRCTEAGSGASAHYAGEMVPRTDRANGQVWIYGKLLDTDLRDVERGDVMRHREAAFAVLFPKLPPAAVHGKRLRLKGVTQHLALDHAAQPVRGEAVCDLTVVAMGR